MGDFEMKMLLVIIGAFIVGVILLVIKDKKNGTGKDPNIMKSNGRTLTVLGLPMLPIAVVTCAAEHYTPGLILGVLGLLFFFGGKEMIKKANDKIAEYEARERQLEMEAQARLAEHAREVEREKLAKAIAREIKNQQQ